MDWISVKQFMPNPGECELEIAYWDGVYMCRCLGIYDGDQWWTNQELIETDGFIVTHWKDCEELPDAPETDDG